MKKIGISDWLPADGLHLEENAMVVVKDPEHSLVVAGPGAGKTELLAQKACYLLQTNTCVFPYKILAISFKKDAAYNLKDRVSLRSGDELSRRFDSFTFDSFAKNIVDRFLDALPSDYALDNNYTVLLRDDTVGDFYRDQNIDYYNYNKNSISTFHTASPLPLSTDNEDEILRYNAWKKMSQPPVSAITFKMIMRLAQLIITTNPMVKQYLQQTYRYVFLDEFQDTTTIQYEFFKSCFLGSETAITAVGDDKQRIMMWAGAREKVFDDFVKDTGASLIPLRMNFRSAPRLVTLLNYLTEHLLHKTDFTKASSKWEDTQGDCSVLFFSNPTSEAEHLLNTLKKVINEDGVNPRDICLLVKQSLPRYAGNLIQLFNENELKARDESVYQDLLTEDVILYIINVMYTAFSKKAIKEKEAAFRFIGDLQTEKIEGRLLQLENIFSKFIRRLRVTYGMKGLSSDQIKSLISEIIQFAGRDRIRSTYRQYGDESYLNKLLSDTATMLIEGYNNSGSLLESLDMFTGKDTIPVMTIHKSKGLEYHTVIFIGLEDGAFWSYQRQTDEDKCAFFVALSRAKERVIFTFSFQRNDKDGNLRPENFTKIMELFKALEDSKIVTSEDLRDKL